MPRRDPVFSIQLDARAPKFLDARGRMIDPDPLRQAFDRVQEAFSRLHGQRLMEVMTAVFAAMPQGEKLWMDWAHDEGSEFFLRFSNGWSLGQHTDNPDDPETRNWQHRNDAKAPAWFPRTPSGLAQWKGWLDLLHCYTIDPGVDGKAHERLHNLAYKRDGLSAQDLPLIRETLVGPVFGAGLKSIRLDEALDPPALGRRGTKQRM